MKNTKYDLFISHASEDKEIFVEILAKLLKEKGLSVWYDVFSLEAGDSIRESIEKGILNSKAGLVILSKNFFKKEWTKKELNALNSLEIGKKNKIIPVWLNVTHSDVLNYSPILADKLAINADEGVAYVVDKILKLLRVEFTNNVVNYDFSQYKQNFYNETKINQKFLVNKCLGNFIRQIAYTESYYSYLDMMIEKYPADEEFDLHDNEIDAHDSQLKILYDIPGGMWNEYNVTSDEIEVELISKKIKLWCKGNLGCVESYKLYFYLHEILDMDSSLVFFSIPERSMYLYQKFDFVNTILDIGARNIDEIKKSREELIKISMQEYYEDHSN